MTDRQSDRQSDRQGTRREGPTSDWLTFVSRFATHLYDEFVSLWLRQQMWWAPVFQVIQCYRVQLLDLHNWKKNYFTRSYCSLNATQCPSFSHKPDSASFHKPRAMNVTRNRARNSKKEDKKKAYSEYSRLADWIFLKMFANVLSLHVNTNIIFFFETDMVAGPHSDYLLRWTQINASTLKNSLLLSVTFLRINRAYWPQLLYFSIIWASH